MPQHENFLYVTYLPSLVVIDTIHYDNSDKVPVLLIYPLQGALEEQVVCTGEFEASIEFADFNGGGALGVTTLSIIGLCLDEDLTECS